MSGPTPMTPRDLMVVDAMMSLGISAVSIDWPEEVGRQIGRAYDAGLAAAKAECERLADVYGSMAVLPYRLGQVEGLRGAAAAIAGLIEEPTPAL